jgi:glucokinase
MPIQACSKGSYYCVFYVVLLPYGDKENVTTPQKAGHQAFRRPGGLRPCTHERMFQNTNQAISGGLVADIGGTNARFAWLDGHAKRVSHIQTLGVAEHGSLAAAARHYLGSLLPAFGPQVLQPQRASLAVATAVAGDRVDFTNSHWAFSRQELAHTLGLQQLIVLNDFEALALSLPRLQAHQWRAVGPQPAPVAGPLAVVGPGTGLGVAGVMPTARGWVAVPGEGGHATLAAGTDFEAQVLAQIRRRYVHVSAERLLSGIGLPNLYRAVAEVMGQPHPGEDVAAEQVVTQGLSRVNPTAVRTLEVFCEMLGAFAGNVALTLGARGGLYIGGGIVPRLGDFFAQSGFRQRFEAKGRLGAYLQDIPTLLITDTLAALEGAALALQQEQASTPG